jgi:anthranilate phosphoribosyltransferase
MIREAIARVVAGEDLTQDEAASVMEEIMTGQATAAQWGSLVTGLRLKGETVAEIAGFASTMRRLATSVAPARPVVDTCGTGGDGRGTFNVSTTAALVAAGAGAHVAKHGNRSMTSQCGSADVLEALGVRLTLTPPQVEECIERAGIGFMFAQTYHPAMKFAAGLRREIGIRTVFNILGPLTNPAGAHFQVLGVAAADLLSRMAEALAILGTHHALVVHGDDGVDEISISSPSHIMDVRDGQIRPYVVAPENFGFERASEDWVKGGDAAFNAAITRAILAGEPGPRRHVVLMNAAAALVACGLADDLANGIRLAGDSIDSGAAADRLQRLVTVSQSFAGIGQ